MHRIPSALLSHRLAGSRLAVLGLVTATGLVAAPALAAVGDDAPTAGTVAATTTSETDRSVDATRAADARQLWVRRSVAPAASPRPRLVPAPPAPAPAPKGLQPKPDGLNWPALAKCESGGNPTIVSRTGKYHGLYQFDRSTWRSVGGNGVPSAAPAAEQTARAQMLYAKRGASPWPVCGRRL